VDEEVPVARLPRFVGTGPAGPGEFVRAEDLERVALLPAAPELLVDDRARLERGQALRVVEDAVPVLVALPGESLGGRDGPECADRGGLVRALALGTIAGRRGLRRISLELQILGEIGVDAFKRDRLRDGLPVCRRLPGCAQDLVDREPEVAVELVRLEHERLRPTVVDARAAAVAALVRADDPVLGALLGRRAAVGEDVAGLVDPDPKLGRFARYARRGLS